MIIITIITNTNLIIKVMVYLIIGSTENQLIMLHVDILMEMDHLLVEVVLEVPNHRLMVPRDQDLTPVTSIVKIQVEKTGHLTRIVKVEERTHLKIGLIMRLKTVGLMLMLKEEVIQQLIPITKIPEVPLKVKKDLKLIVTTITASMISSIIGLKSNLVINGKIQEIIGQITAELKLDHKQKEEVIHPPKLKVIIMGHEMLLRVNMVVVQKLNISILIEVLERELKKVEMVKTNMPLVTIGICLIRMKEELVENHMEEVTLILNLIERKDPELLLKDLKEIILIVSGPVIMVRIEKIGSSKIIIGDINLLLILKIYSYIYS